MYSILLWMLRISCALGAVDSASLRKRRKGHRDMTPESFGH